MLAGDRYQGVISALSGHRSPIGGGLRQHQRDHIAALEATVDTQNAPLADLRQELASGRKVAEARLSALEEILLGAIRISAR